MTTEEKQELIQDVINEITTQSTSIDELDTATSLDQVESLPAYKKDTSTLVRVSMEMISEPATTAAEKADTATAAAQRATAEAAHATELANTATQNAIDATTNASDATAALNVALENINSIKETATDANELAKQLNTQLDNKSIVTITEAEYEALETKEDNTLYFCVEEETEE
jgi:methyl-accepting chemotaxis protein